MEAAAARAWDAAEAAEEAPATVPASEARGSEPLTGAELLVRCLEAEGVEVLFGYPGGAVLPIYDAIYRAGIRHVLVRHEAGAVHAADGYARATGRTGVCLATSGPGATNLVTGLATAHMDSIPLVAFTGNVPTTLIGRDGFQEADITGITMPITKHNFLVQRAEDLPRIVRAAFTLAATGRPGPVLVDLPKDVSNARVAGFRYPRRVTLRGYKPTLQGHPRQLEATAEALAKAKRPVLYLGGGVIAAGAHAEVRELAERASIPTTSTLMGLGAFPPDHPLWMGMLGMHGTPTANYAVTHSDLLIAVGARFDDRVTGRTDRFAPGARIVHIDVDPAEIGKNVEAHIPIVGDAREVLQALLPLVAPKHEAAWLAQVAGWKQRYRLRYRPRPDEILPQELVDRLARTAQAHEEATGREVVVTADVGQHQMWAAQFFPFRRPRSYINSGGLGTMGYGLPAAVGAQVARPDATVVCLTGDGSIQMNVQEMAVVRSLGLPIKVVIMNNVYLGMVRQWQELFYDGRYSHSALFDNPDFVLLAQAYGVPAARVERPQELEAALERAFAEPGPYLLDVRVRPEENCWPMVPAGGAIDEMIGVDEATLAGEEQAAPERTEVPV
ncbi:biosynthetic-type acetolactate synthase large subunit [Limnochorda pilosa]|uniref:Acetolactate synthase n=1 Tax=Limnochorda pilosa TaxID=1555112 RepID=A0A0K2SJ45_LIMPI|nr:biosynthetic-type acetolactate synthase large subunit [Limnochorda pilosa]BAS27110.1 acetolactate synthase [Limnochorda pilosa]